MRLSRDARVAAGRFAAGLFTLAAACADQSAPMAAADLGPSASQSDAPTGSLPLHEIGALRRAAPGDPCSAPEHRQFDFWLGRWDVFPANGSTGAVNVITSGLDGCAVEEHWSPPGGGHGRSLNAYDAETGKWHQTWVTEAQGLIALRLSGGLEDGMMVLAGRKVSAVNPSVIWYDTIRWTPIEPVRVRQVGKTDVPPFFSGGYNILYILNPNAAPAPSPGTPFCQPGQLGGPSRGYDFAVGSWRVETAHGLALAESEIRADLSGCLFEEELATPKGYRSKSHTYYDRVERKWYRTLVDSEGERLELSGGLADGVLTLSGDEPGPGGQVLVVRTTVRQLDAGRLAHQWEVSRDGGVTWQPDRALVYVRR